MNNTTTVLVNKWHANLITRTQITNKGKTVKYLMQINEKEPVRIKPGSIVNDFLCLCRYEDQKTCVFEERTKKWLNKYGMPPITIQETTQFIDPHDDFFYIKDGQYYNFESSKKLGHINRKILPYNWDTYLKAIESRFYDIEIHLRLPQIPPPTLDITLESSVRDSITEVRYVFDNVYSMIMLDYYNILGKYELKICPICQAPYLPVDGRSRCVGGCKPISKLSKTELTSLGIKSDNLSNDNLRSAWVKQLRREGKSHRDMNMILSKAGFKEVRRHKKKK